jgi:hypothetical protein
VRKRPPIHETKAEKRIPPVKAKAPAPGHPLNGLGNQDAGRLLAEPGAGKGKALDSGARARMESGFGANFSRVRVHTDAETAKQAGQLDASAFTAGEHIGFAGGQYRPGTPFGDALLAHELAHVLQQRAGRRERGSPNAEVERRGMEQNADRAAASVMGRMAGQPAGPVAAPGATGLGLQLSSCGKKKESSATSKKPDLAPDDFASPWKAEAVASLIAKTNPETIQFIADEGWTIIRFDQAFDKWRHDDGSVTENDLPGLMGNTRRDQKKIRLQTNLTNREAASTLFHETRHAMSSESSLDDEAEARIATEEFHIRQGWPESVPGYRNPDGSVNREKIKESVTSSSHYNPTGKRRIGRRYTGERVVGGWKKP